MTYGGVQRGRLSSQSQKRSVRMAMQKTQALDKTARSKRLPIDAAMVLAGRGWDPDTAAVAAGGTLAAVGVKPYGDDGRPDRPSHLRAGVGGSRPRRCIDDPWIRQWATMLLPQADARGRRDGARYDLMAERGELRTYPGRVTPVAAFLGDVAADLSGCRVHRLAADGYKDAEIKDFLDRAGLRWPYEFRRVGAGKTAPEM